MSLLVVEYTAAEIAREEIADSIAADAALSSRQGFHDVRGVGEASRPAPHPVYPPGHTTASRKEILPSNPHTCITFSEYLMAD